MYTLSQEFGVMGFYFFSCILFTTHEYLSQGRLYSVALAHS